MKRWWKRIAYRAAGLPEAMRSRRRPAADPSTATIRAAYQRLFWRPASLFEASQLTVALLAWPALLSASLVRSTMKNGPVIRDRTGKPVVQQMVEQLRLYFSASVMPKWYYIFGLYEDGGRDRASNYLHRFETKFVLYPYLCSGATSPLGNKVAFAQHCLDHGLAAVPVLLSAKNGEIRWHVPGPSALPTTDLFIKPVRGRGGRGAERWDLEEHGSYRGPANMLFTEAGLLERLRQLSREGAVLVQPRLTNHQALSDLSNGALCTVRALTLLDEEGNPELAAAAYRIAIGGNVTVDNFHAGGIASSIDLETGRLGPASNLGTDERLGWLSAHPDTGVPIEGRVLPLWDDLAALALRAHAAFADRPVIGWDIAILESGPCLIEGNGAPDLDILQRTARQGLASGRLGELLAFHLRRRLADLQASSASICR